MVSLALCLVLAQLTSPYSGMTWNNPMSSYLDTVIYNRIWARAVSKAPANAPKASFAATDFKTVQPRSVAQAMVSGSKGVTKEQGQALVEGLNAGIDAFEKEARKNNVAHALAFLIGVSLQVANEKEFTDAESMSLAQAINDELAGAPEFKKVTPKQKQLLYETCIVVGSLIGGMAAEAADRKDAELGAQAKAMAKQALSVFQSEASAR